MTGFLRSSWSELPPPIGTKRGNGKLPPFGAMGTAWRRWIVIQAPREGAPKSRRPPLTDGGFFLPVHGVRVLKRIFCKGSLPKTGNKKNRRGFSAGWGSYPGVFLPNGCIVSALVDDRAQVSSCLRDYNVVAPLKSTYP